MIDVWSVRAEFGTYTKEFTVDYVLTSVADCSSSTGAISRLKHASAWD
jgi:hypothetical protein